MPWLQLNVLLQGRVKSLVLDIKLCMFWFPTQAIDVLDEAGSRVRIATWQRYRAAAADIGSSEGARPGPPWRGAWQELSDVQVALREAVRDGCYEEAGK